MAPQPLSTERALLIARVAARGLANGDLHCCDPRLMIGHLQLLEERGSPDDVALALEARVKLALWHPHLYGAARPQTSTWLHDLSHLKCFALGFVGSVVGIAVVAAVTAGLSTFFHHI